MKVIAIFQNSPVSSPLIGQDPKIEGENIKANWGGLFQKFPKSRVEILDTPEKIIHRLGHHAAIPFLLQ